MRRHRGKAPAEARRDARSAFEDLKLSVCKELGPVVDAIEAWLNRHPRVLGVLDSKIGRALSFPIEALRTLLRKGLR